MTTPFARRSLLALAFAAAVLPAAAQQRVIHIVVPFGTGAVQDLSLIHI